MRAEHITHGKKCDGKKGVVKSVPDTLMSKFPVIPAENESAR
jgi:hypothetical protein